VGPSVYMDVMENSQIAIRIPDRSARCLDSLQTRLPRLHKRLVRNRVYLCDSKDGTVPSCHLHCIASPDGRQVHVAYGRHNSKGQNSRTNLGSLTESKSRPGIYIKIAPLDRQQLARGGGWFFMLRVT
jgi:hypothetical protein